MHMNILILMVLSLAPTVNFSTSFTLFACQTVFIIPYSDRFSLRS